MNKMCHLPLIRAFKPLYIVINRKISTGLSFLLQTQKCNFVIGNTHKNVSVHQQSGELLVRPDSL